MANIEIITVKFMCSPLNVEGIKKVCKTQNITPSAKEGPLGSIELHMTNTIPTLFQIAYQCGESGLGITVS